MRAISAALIAVAVCSGAAGAAGRAGLPAWSVVYVSEDARGNHGYFDSEIFTTRADGSFRRRLTWNRAADQYPAWSPDGRRIIFVRDLVGRDDELWTIRADGGAPRMIISEEFETTWPRYSPSGAWIAYQTVPTKSGSCYAILLVRPDASEGRMPVRPRCGANETDGMTWGTAWSWSPDGRAIVFEEPVPEREQGDPPATDVVTVDVESGAMRRIAEMAEQPAWSPQGDLIAYFGPGGLYLVRPDGRGRRRVTVSPAPPCSSCTIFRFAPAWSPDGRQIAYLSDDGDRKAALYVVAARPASRPRALVRLKWVDHTRPVWTRDGRHIIFASDRRILIADAVRGGAQAIRIGSQPALRAER